MSQEWDTKDGRRRVRRDPPTIEDAVLAAQCMAEDDVDAQVEIVMSLMAVSAEEARGAVLKYGQRKDREAARFTIAGTERRTAHRRGRTPHVAPSDGDAADDHQRKSAQPDLKRAVVGSEKQFRAIEK